MTDDDEQNYVDAHQDPLETAIGSALNQIIFERAPNPVLRMGQLLVQVAQAAPGAAAQAAAQVAPAAAAQAAPAAAAQSVPAAAAQAAPAAAAQAAAPTDAAPPVVSPSSSKLPLPEEDEEMGTDKWNLLAWVRGAGLHRVIAAALQQAIAAKGLGDEPESAIAFVRGLEDRSEIDALLRQEAVLDGLGELLLREVALLKSAGAATGKEIQGKFAGAVELSYSGLEKFFGGLEGVVGSPSAQLFAAMEAEHTTSVDAAQEFTTSNYGVTTSAKVEWAFVVNDSPSGPEQSHWPEEAADKLPNRDQCRRKTPLAVLEKKAKAYSAELEQANQPPLVREEIIAANLYTGPMFVKYNAVLRGLQSESPFLRNTMVQLCCPRDVARQYQGSAKTHEDANGSLSFERARSLVNTYTTTLHGINSAIIKLGKLTKATKVYRGISGMALPEEFWQPNNFGVRGGVENAFMSSSWFEVARTQQ